MGQVHVYSGSQQQIFNSVKYSGPWARPCSTPLPLQVALEIHHDRGMSADRTRGLGIKRVILGSNEGIEAACGLVFI